MRACRHAALTLKIEWDQWRVCDSWWHGEGVSMCHGCTWGRIEGAQIKCDIEATTLCDLWCVFRWYRRSNLYVADTCFPSHSTSYWKIKGVKEPLFKFTNSLTIGLLLLVFVFAVGKWELREDWLLCALLWNTKMDIVDCCSKNLAPLDPNKPHLGICLPKLEV